MSANEDDFAPIRALNDLLFCERRCALHRTEGVWIDNAYTLEGTRGHERAHAEPSAQELDAEGHIARGLWLRSDRLRLIGRADVVIFRPDPFPIEYKRGRRRQWDNDDVQLCAQALCLEEMLGQSVTEGAVFHILSRHRRPISFDQALRAKTEAAISRLHDLLESQVTPPPVVKPRCQGCSLFDFCMPATLAQPSRVDRYLAALTVAELSDEP